MVKTASFRCLQLLYKHDHNVGSLNLEKKERPLRKLLSDNYASNEFAWESLNPTSYILALIYRSFSLYTELKEDTVREMFSRRRVLNNLIKN